MKTLAIGISPNEERDDVSLAFLQIFKFWSLKKGEAIYRVEQWFRQFLHVSYAVSFANARSALYVILRSLGVGAGDEVIIQSFTCVVVPNAIVAMQAKPIFVDTTANYVMDYKDLEKKITGKTKAIIVQHTFGIPTDMEKIKIIARRHNIFVIEDVAHTIGAEFKGKKLGTLSDAAIFSFGRDKAFSSVFGGVAVTNNTVLGKKIRDFQQDREYPDASWIINQLMHPVVLSFVLPFYNSILGKAFLVFFQKIRLLSFPVSNSEKNGIFDPESIRKMPNSLCVLAYNQLKKMARYNQARINIVNIYEEAFKKINYKNIPLLRYPLMVDDVARTKILFRKQGIYIGNWYQNIIDPKGTDMNAISYYRGSCPTAEKLAKHTINLPVLPSMKNEDTKRIIDILKQYGN